MSTIAAPGRSAPTSRHVPSLTPRRELQIFLVIVLAPWLEHLAQACEIYVLGMETREARGGLGLLWPWLVSSEAMQYGYAFVVLVGLFYLRKHFDGAGARWWTAALVLQVWHHLEHQLLLGQAVLSQPLFDASEPTSFLQLVIPRSKLHLFYNAAVFAPMLVAMYLRHRQTRAAEPEARHLPAAEA
ncbi:MAG TPA: hypothetical protein VGO80_23020 [Solirubrobacteraceae bacterium]|jgi:hypothetical protein|nr:hypothetical protein [Solirubrobacteraceae bacterium]